MDKIIETIGLHVIIISVIVALFQNMIVDIFKIGKDAEIKNTTRRWINRGVLVLSGILMFVVFWVTGMLTIQESVFMAILSTIISYIFYKVKIYDAIINVFKTAKTGIINLIKSKTGDKE